MKTKSARPPASPATELLAEIAKRAFIALVASAALALSAQPAAAESRSDLFEDKPFYIEGGLGIARQFPEDSDSRLAISGGLALGYQFHRNIALELSYTSYNLGGQETEGETFNTNLLALCAKVTFPFGGTGTRLYFELGPASYQYAYDTFDSFAIPTTLGIIQLAGTFTLEKSGVAPYLALGFDWILPSGLFFGVEYSYTIFSIEDADAGFEEQGSGQTITTPFLESLNHSALGIFVAVGYRF